MTRKKKDEKNRKIISIKIVRMECQLWSKAILMQISRISRNKNAVDYNKKLQRMADEHYLRISLYKLYDWMKYLNKYIKGVDVFIRDMKKLYKITMLRHMSEHQREYYENMGDEQKKFINQETNQSLLISSIINHKHYLSGKIDTNELKKLIKRIDDFFESNNYKLRDTVFCQVNNDSENNKQDRKPIVLEELVKDQIV